MSKTLAAPTRAAPPPFWQQLPKVFTYPANGDALVKIASRFNQRENTYWASDLQIVNFEKIRETAYRPWAANTIPRRFCSGIVEVTDGRKHTIHYSIAEDSGMIGASWGIEWCIVGLDRNWAYNPACKMARP